MASSSSSPEVEYRLVLEGGVCRDEVIPIVHAENARRLAESWEGRTSESTGQTGRVERREVTPWEPVSAPPMQVLCTCATNLRGPCPEHGGPVLP